MKSSTQIAQALGISLLSFHFFSFQLLNSTTQTSQIHTAAHDKSGTADVLAEQTQERLDQWAKAEAASPVTIEPQQSFDEAINHTWPNVPAELPAEPVINAQTAQTAFVGEQVLLLTQATDNRGYLWYYIEYARSGERAWIRQDFLRQQCLPFTRLNPV